MNFHELGLATCSYTAFDQEMGTPVRTSQGHPRFRLRYTLEHKVEALMPVGLRDVHDIERFTPLYRARLDAHAGEIAERLAAIAAATGKRPVLLCFENVHLPGKWCHRQVAAGWLADRTGLSVPELSTPTPAKAKVTAPKPRPQMTMFGEIEIPRRTR